MPTRSPPSDFPFYNGQPVALRPGQWAWLMLAVALGFAALCVPWGTSGPAEPILRALLFPAVPLLALRALAGPHWRALFGRLSWKDVLLALGIALLNIGVTAVVAILVLRLFGANANPAFEILGKASVDGRLLFLVQTLPQLLGEEVLTVLPFLGVLALLKARTRLSRRNAIVIAWLSSALLFGMLHLPTYQWNWAQCVLVIGSARLVLSLAYLRTRNLWVSTLAHVLNDWALFAAGLLLPALASSA